MLSRKAIEETNTRPIAKGDFETFFCAGLSQLSCHQFPQDGGGRRHLEQCRGPGAEIPVFPGHARVCPANPWGPVALGGEKGRFGREDTSLHSEPSPSFLILYLPNPAPRLDSNHSGSFTNLSQQLPLPAELGWWHGEALSHQPHPD